MKRLVLFLIGSLVANAAFAVFYFSRDSAPASDPTEQARAATALAEANAKTQAAREEAAHSQLWRALNSDDLPTLIARLRAAGFPPTIVRAVVNARIQARFSARMNALASAVEDAPFWRPAPNSFRNPKFSEERTQIYRERVRLLRELLGDDFFAEAGSDPTAAQRRQFGDLPKSKIDLIQRIDDDYAEMTSQAKAATRGITLPEDREKLALLGREKRADLAAILTPQELEDYEMRSSPFTLRLRDALTLMDASETEFRAIFRLQQQFNDRISPVGGVIGAEMSRQRREATAEMNAQLKTTLGETRAAEFSRSSNYEFQQLVQVAQRENLPAASAVRAYDLRRHTAEESLRISNDTALSTEQKLVAMQTLAQNTKAQLTATLGQSAGSAYAKSAVWLQAIERGNAVTFEGSTTTFRSLPTPSPTTPRN